MPAPQSRASTSLADPCKCLRFRVKSEGDDVAGCSKVSGLTRTTWVMQRRAGGDPDAVRLGPGQPTCGPITLERERHL